MLKYRLSLILATGVLLSVPSPSWSQVSINFEGIGDSEPVGEFYANRSVHFAANFLALDDAAHVFDNPPSPVNVGAWGSGSSSIIDHDHGFVNAFTFSYTSHNALLNDGTNARVEAWSGAGATGLPLGSLSLPDTPRGQPTSGNDFGLYRVWDRKSFFFPDIARSIRFVGTRNNIAIDDLFFQPVDPCNVSASIQLSAVAGLKSRNVGSFVAQTDARLGGRIFLDTVDNGAILGTINKQRLKFTAQITPASIPSSCFTVRWEVRDPDDPAGNFDIDRNGLAGGDNTGTAHEGATNWFTGADHSISNVMKRPGQNENTVIGEARTTLGPIGGAFGSTVYFHATDDGGDNFQVRAVLVRTSNQGAQDHAQDNSGVMTMWRQRTLRESWMLKPMDDVAIHKRGTTPGPFVRTIKPGANFLTDTLIVEGDDRRVGEFIDSGSNGVAQTTPNSGTLSAEAIAENIRLAYSQGPFDNLAYIDWTPSISDPNRPHNPTLGITELANYMDNVTNFAHQPDGIVSLLGADHLFSSQTTQTILGAAVAPPHCVVAVGNIKKLYPDRLQKTNAHEIGHLLIEQFEVTDPSFHSVHTAGQSCAFGTGPVPPQICSRHVSLLRDRIARDFGASHNYPLVINDSLPSR